jgi:hypothetical protein
MLWLRFPGAPRAAPVGVASSSSGGGIASSSVVAVPPAGDTALVVAVPPAGETALVAGARDSRAAGDWVRVDVAGGYLMWSKAKGELNAHCTRHGSDGRTCKCDRVAGPRPGVKGRPLGRHLLWLAMGEVLNAADHIAFKLKVCKADHHAERLAHRIAFAASAVGPSVDLLNGERPPHGGEGAEPLVSP